LELRQYYYVVRRWVWLVALGVLLAGAAAYVTSQQMTPVYEASTTLRISAPGSQAVSDYSALVASQRLAQTYAELLRTDPVLDGVIANLDLEMSTGALRGAVGVRAVRDTELVEITVEHADPAVAQAVANEIPVVFAQQEQALQSSRYSDLKARLEAKLAALEEEIQALQQEIAARKAAAGRTGDGELALLESDLEQARSNYTTLLQNLGQVELAEAQAGTSVLVAAPARTPKTPVRPQTARDTLLAAVVGGMLGLGAAFLLEYLDDTLKTPDDVQASLGAVTLAVVVRAPDGERPVPLMSGEGNGAPIAEPTWAW
jgi:succinoglycan biosynthesis transport protein ExoP